MNFFPLLFCLFLLGCTGEDEHIAQPHEIEGQRILKETADWARTRLGLFPSGSGGGMMHDISKLSLSFGYIGASDVVKARCIMVTVLEEFLRRINEDESLRPYLSHYPFTERDVWVLIHFFDSNGDLQKPPSLGYVTLAKGSILYKENIPRGTPFEVLHHETFPEAQRIVREQGCVLPAGGE